MRVRFLVTDRISFSNDGMTTHILKKTPLYQLSNELRQTRQIATIHLYLCHSSALQCCKWFHVYSFTFHHAKLWHYMKIFITSFTHFRGFITTIEKLENTISFQFHFELNRQWSWTQLFHIGVFYIIFTDPCNIIINVSWYLISNNMRSRSKSICYAWLWWALRTIVYLYLTKCIQISLVCGPRSVNILLIFSKISETRREMQWISTFVFFSQALPILMKLLCK